MLQDEGYADSVFGSDNSDSTSITSSTYQGYMENGWAIYDACSVLDRVGEFDDPCLEAFDSVISPSILDSCSFLWSFISFTNERTRS